MRNKQAELVNWTTCKEQALNELSFADLAALQFKIFEKMRVLMATKTLGR